jgi:hypothetical protein
MDPRNVPVDVPLPAAASGTIASQAHKVGAIFPSTSRAAAAYTSDPMDNPMHPGVRLWIDITDKGASGTVTTKVQCQDPASQNWIDLAGAVTTALGTVSTNMLTIFPGATVAANVSISTHLGRKWRVVTTVAANAVTHSISGEYLCSG